MALRHHPTLATVDKSRGGDKSRDRGDVEGQNELGEMYLYLEVAESS